MIDLDALPETAVVGPERTWLRDQAAALPKDAVIVHLGVALGASLMCSRAGNATADLVGIDLDISRLHPVEGVILIEADSNSYQLETEPDFVFVDADHSKGAVLADILTWGPQVKAGGILAFHDYGNSHFRWCAGVKAAVDDWDWTGWEEIAGARSIKAFRKLESKGNE
jgi:23S rRNA U2552 (ribose-2'-O)-methylase RlmE/FtsJ